MVRYCSAMEQNTLTPDEREAVRNAAHAAMQNFLAEVEDLLSSESTRFVAVPTNTAVAARAVLRVPRAEIPRRVPPEPPDPLKIISYPELSALGITYARQH